MEPKILIVEDQFIEANNLRISLQKAGYTVCSIASSVDEAIGIKNKERPDLVLLDIRLQGKASGIDLARILRAENIAFIFLSANSSNDVLNAAKTTRPYGFLVKPFREKDVLVALDVAWYLHRQSQKPIAEKSDAELKEIIGNSPSMVTVVKNIRIVANSSISVLILGESGTGKELVAQCIHRVSDRRGKPLVVVNCAALPANLVESELFGHEKGAFTGANGRRIGKFEQASEGTVFLDEIGELTPDLQSKLLRVLQEKEIDVIGGEKRKIDVRIIAATNRNLEEEVAAGRFRLDLYYRLNVFPIQLPPLRERKEDLLPLATHFLQVYAEKEKKKIRGLADHVLDAMMSYSWPGNIRELENSMARSVLLATGDIINDLYLPSGNSGKPAAQTADGGEVALKTIDENERDHILTILRFCGGKIAGDGGAAQILGVPPGTLYSKLKRLGIKRGHSA